jgi:hypothetical protein
MTTDLERQLTDDLHELADHESATPDLAAIERRGRALRRRGLAARSTAGVAGVAIVAGATVLATAANTGPAPTALPSVHTIAVRMVAAVKQATSNSTYIETMDTGQDISTIYKDLPSSSVEQVYANESGTLLAKTGMRWHGSDWDIRVVDYQKRAWGQVTRPADKNFRVPPDGFGAIGSPAGPLDPAPGFANAFDVGQLENTGHSEEKTPGVTYTYTLTGTETVDGQVCYRIVRSVKHATLDTWWISKATGLPVKQTQRSGAQTIVSTYQWQVPRDKAPASLWPTPPAGFTHVAK